jgi:hypothetical protein
MLVFLCLYSMMIRVNDTSVLCPTVHSTCFRCREVRPKAFTRDTASEPLPPPLRSVSTCPIGLLHRANRRNTVSQCRDLRCGILLRPLNRTGFRDRVLHFYSPCHNLNSLDSVPIAEGGKRSRKPIPLAIYLRQLGSTATKSSGKTLLTMKIPLSLCKWPSTTIGRRNCSIKARSS